MNPFRRGKPETGPRVTPAHPLMQAHVDMTRRYIVATDHAVWGSFDELSEATRRCDLVAKVIPVHERVMVSTSIGHPIYALTGENQRGETLRRVVA